MRFSTRRRAPFLCLAALAGIAPALRAQTRSVPAPSTVMKPTTVGTSAAARTELTMAPTNVAAFRQSVQISVDSTQWMTSAVMFSGCSQGTASSCDAGAPPRKVYLRWTQITPATNMTAAHQGSMAFTQPYQVVADSLPGICGGGGASSRPSPGRTVDVNLAGQAGRIPFTCSWRVTAVVPSGVPGQFTTVQSNPVTLLVRNAAGRPPHGR